MAEATPEIDLDSVIDRLLEGEIHFLLHNFSTGQRSWDRLTRQSKKSSFFRHPDLPEHSTHPISLLAFWRVDRAEPQRGIIYQLAAFVAGLGHIHPPNQFSHPSSTAVPTAETALCFLLKIYAVWMTWPITFFHCLQKKKLC